MQRDVSFVLQSLLYLGRDPEMRKLIFALIASASLLTALLTVSLAAQKSQTYTGEIMDQQCGFIKASLKYVRESANEAEGLRGVMWSLLNTREFLLQH